MIYYTDTHGWRGEWRISKETLEQDSIIKYSAYTMYDFHREGEHILKNYNNLIIS